MKTYTLVGRMSIGSTGFVIKTRIPADQIKTVLAKYKKTWRYLEMEEELKGGWKSNQEMV